MYGAMRGSSSCFVLCDADLPLPPSRPAPTEINPPTQGISSLLNQNVIDVIRVGTVGCMNAVPDHLSHRNNPVMLARSHVETGRASDPCGFVVRRQVNGARRENRKMVVFVLVLDEHHVCGNA